MMDKTCEYEIDWDFFLEPSQQACLFHAFVFLLLNMYDGGHLASFICPTMLLLSFTYACQYPYVHCCIPFLFAFSLLLLHFCALPQMRPYKSSFRLFSTNNQRGRCNLFTCHSFSLLFQFLPSSITMLLTMPIFFADLCLQKLMKYYYYSRLIV